MCFHFLVIWYYFLTMGNDTMKTLHTYEPQHYREGHSFLVSHPVFVPDPRQMFPVLTPPHTTHWLVMDDMPHSIHSSTSLGVVILINMIRVNHPTSCSGWKQINALKPRQNGRHFPDDIFKCIFLHKLLIVPKGTINNIAALVRQGDKPLFEPMMVRLLTQICVMCWARRDHFH